MDRKWLRNAGGGGSEIRNEGGDTHFLDLLGYPLGFLLRIQRFFLNSDRVSQEV